MKNLFVLLLGSPLAAFAEDPTNTELAKQLADQAKLIQGLSAKISTPTSNEGVFSWGVGVFIFVVILLGGLALFALFKRAFPKDETSSQKPDEGYFRSLLARTLTFGALFCVIAIAAIILVGAALNAIAQKDPAITDKFLEIGKYILAAVLPVMAGWVGTVLAFYFGKENFEAATKSVRDTVKALSSNDKLASIPASQLGLPREQIALLKVKKADKEALKLNIVETAFTKDGKTYERLPVVYEEDGAPFFILHYSTLTKFLMGQINAAPSKSSKDFSLKDLFQGPPPFNPLTSFVTVKTDASAVQAKAAVEAVKDCADILVTKDGTPKSEVVSWITNVDLLTASQI